MADISWLCCSLLCVLIFHIIILEYRASTVNSDFTKAISSHLSIFSFIGIVNFGVKWLLENFWISMASFNHEQFILENDSYWPNNSQKVCFNFLQINGFNNFEIIICSKIGHIVILRFKSCERIKTLCKQWACISIAGFLCTFTLYISFKISIIFELLYWSYLKPKPLHLSSNSCHSL